MAKLVSTRYAHALFSCAQQGDLATLLDKFSQDARFILESLEQNPDLARFIVHPHITAAEKIEALEGILLGRVSEEVMGLIVLVVQKRREGFMGDIFADFLKMADEHNNVATAYVTTAIPVDEGRLEAIRGVLVEKFGKNVVVETLVDRTQVGGMKVLVQGYSFDRTIKSYINELQTKL